MYTEIKNLINEYGRDATEELVSGNIDFEADGIRFIEESEAYEEVYNMYKADLYILGCFNAWFISNYICLDTQSIEMLQKNEGYEGLGAAIINSGNFENMMNDYISADGWAHALNSYDGSYDEIIFNKQTYIVFKV